MNFLFSLRAQSNENFFEVEFEFSCQRGSIALWREKSYSTPPDWNLKRNSHSSVFEKRKYSCLSDLDSNIWYTMKILFTTLVLISNSISKTYWLRCAITIEKPFYSFTKQAVCQIIFWIPIIIKVKCVYEWMNEWSKVCNYQ